MDKKLQKVGVIGAGSFGSAIANIVAVNVSEVLVYARSENRLENFNVLKKNNGFPVLDNVRATSSIEEITQNCTLLIFLVPSKSFRSVAREFSPHLRPYHIIIHGTKGVDIKLPDGVDSLEELTTLDRENIFTMSEVINQETPVKRVGCLSGPNLSVEMQMGQPSGAIVASHYDEVYQIGRQALNTDSYKIFSSHDLAGAEFAGVLKNIYAISSGILHGLGFEINARSLLITKGLHEMLYIGKSLGADTSAFLGIAGVGDLVATCSSTLSRNFAVGDQIARGKSLDEVINSMDEVAEGVRSVQIFHAYCKKNNLIAPFTETLYEVLFEGKSPSNGLKELMSFRYSSDVSFL